jgi:hypothetical protein
MKSALLVVLLATHGCQTGAAPLVIPAAHRADIERQLFTPVARVGDLPIAVRAALRLLPGDLPALADAATIATPPHDLILLGCAPDHCLVHYEHRAVFYLVLLGIASRVLVEWAGVLPEPLGSLAAATTLVLQASPSEVHRTSYSPPISAAPRRRHESTAQRSPRSTQSPQKSGHERPTSSWTS